MLPFGQLGFGVLRQRLALQGRYQVVRWCLNEVFSKAGHDVALRAIG